METGRISEGAGGSPGLFSSGSDNGGSGQFSREDHIAYRGSNNHPGAPQPSGFSLRFFMDLPGSATGGVDRSRRSNLEAGNALSEGSFSHSLHGPKITAYKRAGAPLGAPAQK